MNPYVILKTAVAVRTAAQLPEIAAAFLSSVLTLTVPGFRAKNRKSFALLVICTTVLSLTAVFRVIEHRSAFPGIRIERGEESTTCRLTLASAKC